MEEIIQQILPMLPCVASIAGIVATGITTLKKVHEVIKDSSNALEEVRSTSEFNSLCKAVKSLVEENRALRADVRRLTDRIAKIEGYSDEMERMNK